MTFQLGRAGLHWSAAMKGMMAMYGGHLQGVDRTNYAPPPDPIGLADTAAKGASDALGCAGLRFIQQLALPGLTQRQQQTLAYWQRNSDFPARDPFVSEVLRVFDLSARGIPWRLASYVRLGAAKLDIGMPGVSAAGGLLGMLGALGQQGPRNGSPGATAAGSFADNWRTHDQASYTRDGTIAWGVELVATLACPSQEFDSELNMFLSTLNALQVHGDIESLTREAVRQQDAAVQQATQGALAHQQAAARVPRIIPRPSAG